MSDSTPVGKLLLEALVVAVVFTVLFFVVHIIAMALLHESAMTNHLLLAAQVALTAFLGLIALEYTGLNGWYCKHRD